MIRGEHAEADFHRRQLRAKTPHGPPIQSIAEHSGDLGKLARNLRTRQERNGTFWNFCPA